MSSSLAAVILADFALIRGWNVHSSYPLSALTLRAADADDTADPSETNDAEAPTPPFLPPPLARSASDGRSSAILLERAFIDGRNVSSGSTVPDWCRFRAAVCAAADKELFRDPPGGAAGSNDVLVASTPPFCP